MADRTDGATDSEVKGFVSLLVDRVVVKIDQVGGAGIKKLDAGSCLRQPFLPVHDDNNSYAMATATQLRGSDSHASSARASSSSSASSGYSLRRDTVSDASTLTLLVPTLQSAVYEVFGVYASGQQLWHALATLSYANAHRNVRRQRKVHVVNRKRDLYSQAELRVKVPPAEVFVLTASAVESVWWRCERKDFAALRNALSARGDSDAAGKALLWAKRVGCIDCGGHKRRRDCDAALHDAWHWLRPAFNEPGIGPYVLTYKGGVARVHKPVHVSLLDPDPLPAATPATATPLSNVSPQNVAVASPREPPRVTLAFGEPAHTVPVPSLLSPRQCASNVASDHAMLMSIAAAVVCSGATLWRPRGGKAEVREIAPDVARQLAQLLPEPNQEVVVWSTSAAAQTAYALNLHTKQERVAYLAFPNHADAVHWTLRVSELLNDLASRIVAGADT